ncbi:MAG TPA: AraC family transcriptional regulator [Ramlibacter sp.]|nr:AraC family transcriptional regulator [Ramlibacter sp.]
MHIKQAASDRLLWLSADRLLYAGLLGEASVRSFGAYTLYVSLGGPSRASIDGGDWESADLVVVPPYVPHRIVAGGRSICKVMIEAETVDSALLPPLLRGPGGGVDAPELVARVHGIYARLLRSGRETDFQQLDFDRDVIGHALAARVVDPRIAAALAHIRNAPSGPATAEDMADLAGLSFSRFLHLFKQETGTSLRNLRAWKRARSLLHYVSTASNLTDIALDAGYPDSTHFSHSIRRIYGLKPRDIVAGSRKLTVFRPVGHPIPEGSLC